MYRTYGKIRSAACTAVTCSVPTEGPPPRVTTRAKVGEQNSWSTQTGAWKNDQRKSQLSDLCSVAKHSHTHTKHQTSPTTGWCPNVTQKRKKELQLSDWGEVNKWSEQPVDFIDLISSKITTNIIKNECEMKKHTVFWIQFNVSILWCPENILLLSLRIVSLTIDFQILILTYIKLTEAVVTAAIKKKKLHISQTSMDQRWPMTKGLIKTIQGRSSSHHSLGQYCCIGSR